MNWDECVDLLTVVAAYDRRQVGKVDIQAWLPIMAPWSFDEARDAVVAHFVERPGVWLEPGFVVARCRAARQDTSMRSSAVAAVEPPLPGPEVRERGMAAVREVLGAEPSGEPTWPMVRCGWCKAGEGEPCVLPDGRPRASAHPARLCPDCKGDGSLEGGAYCQHPSVQVRLERPAEAS